jgi:two-component system chemotaxis response regulator CheY
MPEMTGIELLQALRGAGKTVTFGFITSETTPEMRERAIAAGAQFFLAKPFTADEVSQILSVV